MSEFEFNCMTQANHLMTAGSQSHHAAVYIAHRRQANRAANRKERQDRREKVITRTVNFCLGAMAAIGALTAIGFLATVVR